MPMIKESFLLEATDTDILAAPSRLAAIPANGVMTVETSTSDAESTNNGALTIQLPNGDIPLDLVVIPAWAAVLGADGVLDARTQMALTFGVGQGGHVLLQYTMTGVVSLCIMHVTLTF